MMSSKDDIESWVEYFKADGIEPWIDHGDAIAIMQATHPRTVFIKTLPRHAGVLDVGAGDGRLPVLKTWPWPERRDLCTYAYAMEKGTYFDDYDAYEIGVWPSKKPRFENTLIHAIIAAHFIEHIPEVPEFLRWCFERLELGGRIYLEWPSEYSKTLPPKTEFQKNGIPVVISNFYDDGSHREIPDRAAIVGYLDRLGMSVDSEGFVHNPFIDEELRAHFKIAAKAGGGVDLFSLLSAFWSHSRWAQYVIATKI